MQGDVPPSIWYSPEEGNDALLVYGNGRFPGLPAMYSFLKFHEVKTFYNGVNNAHSFYLRYTSQSR